MQKEHISRQLLLYTRPLIFGSFFGLSIIFSHHFFHYAVCASFICCRTKKKERRVISVIIYFTWFLFSITFKICTEKKFVPKKFIAIFFYRIDVIEFIIADIIRGWFDVIYAPFFSYLFAFIIDAISVYFLSF